jgi:hypothetical protein
VDHHREDDEPAYDCEREDHRPCFALRRFTASWTNE